MIESPSTPLTTPRAPSFAASTSFLLIALCVSACAEADLPTSFEEPPVRESEKVDRPYDELDLNTRPGDDMMPDLDLGTPDAGGDAGPGDMLPDADMRIIDPADTRNVLALAISASLNAPIPDWRPGVFRM